jgi:hypothetical protein
MVGLEIETSISQDEQKTKELFKQAMLELLEERKEVFYDLFAAVIEDTILVHAIRAGEATDTVDRSEILAILEGAS